MARRLVEVVDHLPDLLLGQPVFPGGHGRVPWRRFLGQAGAALGDAPEHEALGELGDRVRADEVGRLRVEAVCEVPPAVQEVAVTVHAVPHVDGGTGRQVLLPVGRRLLHVLPDRGVGVLEIDLLAAEADRVRRRGMDRAELERRLGPRRRLGVSVVTDQEGDADPEDEAQRSAAGLCQRPPDRRHEGPPGVRVRRDVDQHRHQRDRHVQREHAEGHGRPDAVPEEECGHDQDQGGLEELPAGRRHRLGLGLGGRLGRPPPGPRRP